MGKIKIGDIDVLDIVNESVDTLAAAAKLGAKVYVLTTLTGLRMMSAAALNGARKIEKDIEKETAKKLTMPMEDLIKEEFGEQKPPRKSKKVDYNDMPPAEAGNGFAN